MKKFLKITGITLLIILAILFAAPLLFKGKIIALVKKEINESINARVEFVDVDVSLLRRFPRASAAIEQLSIVGLGQFSADTLLSARNIDIAIDLMSLLKGDKISVHAVNVNHPRIRALIGSDGKANWDILKEDTAAVEDTSSQAFRMELSNYVINNGYIVFRDSSSGMNSIISGLNHKGSGDFTEDRFILSTKTAADAVSFTYGTIPYLTNTKTIIEADIDIDNNTSTYTFKSNEILLNALKIAADGFFRLVNDSTYDMDIRFNAPSTDFKEILSLIPVIYQNDFADVKASGKASFGGMIKGAMAGEKLPAYQIALEIADGHFQYSDLPAPVENINLKLNINNPDGITDHTVIDLSNFHFKIENDPFDISLIAKTPVSDMWIDAAAKGKIDLSKLSRIVKLEKRTKLAGVLNANVAAKGYVDAVQKQQLDKFSANGTIALNGFHYESEDYPDGVTLNKLLLTFNPQNVTLNEASGKYLNSNFAANGSVNNLLAYALTDRPLDGVVNVKADRLNVNDWVGSTDTTAEEDTTAVFIVPANLDLLLNAQVDEITYDNLVMRNVSGAVQVANETLKMDNVKGNALDGTIAISGSYSTRINKKKPAIALQYDVQDLDVQKTFNTFVTVQKLMPIGEFLGGKLSSKMVMTGYLGENMFPDLTTLTGNGTVLLVQGLLQKFKPLDQLANKLNINELKNISIREVREQFEFDAGKVFVKPFKLTVGGIEMEVAGMHGFDQSLDYTIHLKLPRSMIGSQGNQIVNDLITKANNRGIPVKGGETINMNVKMGGSISNPSLQFDLKETTSSLAEEVKDQAREFAQAKIDSTKKAVTDTLQSLKKEAIKGVADELKKQLFGAKDTTVTSDTGTDKSQNPADRLKESGKGLIENINPFKKKK